VTIAPWILLIPLAGILAGVFLVAVLVRRQRR
jgi:hypothetical protein